MVERLELVLLNESVVLFFLHGFLGFIVWVGVCDNSTLPHLVV
jgi:hypothetical protein